ncbi:hypothetical protein P10159_4536 [Citrobacter portucalensis]|nr:hypothetical protein P10159_4536 [Citrobacter portucalensis]
MALSKLDCVRNKIEINRTLMELINKFRTVKINYGNKTS